MSSSPKSYESVVCNLCGADDPAVLLPALPPNGGEHQFAASGESPLRDRLVRCKKCGLVYVSPRLKQQAIESGYENVDNTVYIEQAAGRLQTFQRALQWLDTIGVAKGQVLDIGCAAGFFVRAAQDAGWKATGIEISKHLCEYGRNQLGVNILQGTLENSTLPPHSFDLVTFWDVLEHVSDPTDALERARKLLKPGGYLLVNYPHYGSIWAKLLRRRWWFLIDVHIYYFTPRTLAKLLRKCGFTPKHERMHFQTLPLGYLTDRVKSIFPKLGGAVKTGVRLTHMDNLPFTYYASQKSCLAQVTDGPKR